MARHTTEQPMATDTHNPTSRPVRRIVIGAALLGLGAFGVGFGVGYVAAPESDTTPTAEALLEWEGQLVRLAADLDKRQAELDEAEASADAAQVDPAPETEPTEDDGDEPAADAGETGGRDNPLPLGTTGTVGAWEVRITEVAVGARERYGDPPSRDGYVFVEVALAGTFLGDPDYPEGNPGMDLTVTIVGNDNRQYADYDGSGIPAKDWLLDEPTLEAGGEFAGRMLLEVPQDVSKNLDLLYVEDNMSWSAERLHFAL